LGIGRLCRQLGEGTGSKEANRHHAFSLLADTIAYDKKEALTILDLGAGYGALTKFLLDRFPKATAICHDGSEEMAKLGRQRMKEFDGRFAYVIADFSRHGWSRLMPGPFGAVVSSIALHNVGSPTSSAGSTRMPISCYGPAAAS
jgi:ubiquinone/menaquinone biosynthesis C-methylase UbiE